VGHERANVNVPESQTILNHLGIVNGYYEAEAIVPDVEDHKTIHIVGVGEDRPQVLKIPPSSRLHDLDPGAYLTGSFPVTFRRFLEAFDRDDVHFIDYFANCEVSRRTICSSALQWSLRNKCALCRNSNPELPLVNPGH
jgi:hypothetical protein